MFVKLMGMLDYSSPVPVPVVQPLPTGTGNTRRRARPHGAAQLSAPALFDLVRRSAAQLPPFGGPSGATLDQRRYELLERTATYELWVIQWPQDTGLVLHDHGGSAGAFYVTAGMLEETSSTVRGHRLRRRRLWPNEGKSFGADYVHSVGNPKVEVAVSVHAYSPPLTSLTFYSRYPTGLVVSHVETDWEGAP
jgi:Cysteine dioxygenase type I